MRLNRQIRRARFVAMIGLIVKQEMTDCPIAERRSAEAHHGGGAASSALAFTYRQTPVRPLTNCAKFFVKKIQHNSQANSLPGVDHHTFRYPFNHPDGSL